jgi:hypothetical protein
MGITSRKPRGLSPRHYKGVVIWPRNIYGMYSANCCETPLAADTLFGMKTLISETLAKHGLKRQGV